MDHVKNFLSSSHKGDSTEVCSETAPAVVQEHIKPVEKVEVTEAVDRERHIHHHQHRVQPVEAHEVKATEHKHNILPEVTREHKEDMLPEHREKLEAMRTQQQNVQQVGSVERTEAHQGAVANESVIHHVHETIQPVVQKETIAPTTVHTTVPIHEKIHEAPIVHEATTLPTVTLDEFKTKIGGAHSHKDGNHHHQFYQGEPRIGGGQTTTTGAATTTHQHGVTDSSRTTGSGLTGAATGGQQYGTGVEHSHSHTHTTGSGLTGDQHHTSGRV
jgi:hypothetical protein